MNIEISTKEIFDVELERKRIYVIGVEALEAIELPKEYLDGECVYLDYLTGLLHYIPGTGEKCLIGDGHYYSEKEMVAALMIIERCEHRLKQINTRIQKISGGWGNNYRTYSTDKVGQKVGWFKKLVKRWRSS